MSGICWSCEPSCIVSVMTEMCPPLLQPLCIYPVLYHFCLSLHTFLPLPPLASVQVPPSWPPPFWPPTSVCISSCLSLASLSSLPHCISATVSTQLNYRNTVSGNLYLPHSSALLRTHFSLINKQHFVQKQNSKKIRKKTGWQVFKTRWL